MSQKLLLAKQYTADGVASVTTDGVTVWVVGAPALPENTSPGAAAVSLPLDFLLKALAVHEAHLASPRRKEAVQPGCGDCGHSQSDHVYTDCFGDENRCTCAGFMPPETVVTA